MISLSEGIQGYLGGWFLTVVTVEATHTAYSISKTVEISAEICLRDNPISPIVNKLAKPRISPISSHFSKEGKERGSEPEKCRNIAGIAVLFSTPLMLYPWTLTRHGMHAKTWESFCEVDELDKVQIRYSW